MMQTTMPTVLAIQVGSANSAKIRIHVHQTHVNQEELVELPQTTFMNVLVQLEESVSIVNK